ncbi:hypothetical protein EG68_04734 [Paragonimus skrjabini miyazakii]|uniref:P-type ATPase C-terminal domain-containing protein n=1 Tax=Paragonimus skrjabini miyazakii TaxID=59628 RepID=A0A8S9YDV3_9TREM|nr:hypothetical protein EG68_04734 [Paragonimus skrjabini miyazakii]
MHILPFDSVRKRMSILIRHPATDEAVLYTKGADSAIFHRVHCANEEESKRLELTRAHVEEFSRVGLRTLVLVKRIVPEEELKAWSREYVIAEATASDSSNALRALMDRIERNFTLLGATGIEDRLQPGVPETIGHLREAGIHVWVLTGDKQETAVNVAHSARLITKEHQLIYINASSKLKTGYLINRHLHSLVCGHPWADCDEINDVMSDDPDVESSSTSTSESESDQAMDPTIIAAFSNQRHVRVCPPEGNLSDSHPSCVPAPAWTRFTRRSKHRITRSVSESRAVTQKRRRRRPRLVRRHRTHLLRERPVQRRSQASLESANLALVIDGETLQFALEEDMKASFLRLARLCTSVLCCRSTPSQKAAVVSLVKDGLHVLTLAVGDGAKEGMQAVMASDFAISRFRFLQRLILVHGHLCYDKLAHTALYLFYKDAVYIFLLFWFQLFNGFSGSNAIDQLSQVLFSVTMTSLPPFLMGIWDNPIDADTLLANPVLYRSGIEGRAYRPWLFWINILDAIWQTLIIFFVPYLFYADSTMTLWSYGMLQMNLLLLCSLLHAALETRTWVYLHWIGLLLSYLVFYIIFTMIYHSLAVTGISPESPYRVIFVTMHDATFWLLIPITVTAALLPRLLFITLNNTLAPTLDTVATLLSKVYGCGKRLPLTPYLSGKLDTSAPIESISSGLSHFTPPSATEPSGRPISGSSRSSLPSVEVEPVEAPARFMARVEQLLSVSSRLFRGAASSTAAAASTIGHRRSLTAPISPLSMENVRHQNHGIAVDLRHRMYNRRRSRTRTLSYGAGRLEQVLTAIPFSRNSNNFDDAAGLPSTPVIWPVVDPRTRAHSLTMRRYPERRIRPTVNDSTFRDQASSLPMDPSFYTPTSQAADSSYGDRQIQGDVELRVGRLAPQVDSPPPYRLSECSASETENQQV